MIWQKISNHLIKSRRKKKTRSNQGKPKHVTYLIKPEFSPLDPPMLPLLILPGMLGPVPTSLPAASVGSAAASELAALLNKVPFTLPLRGRDTAATTKAVS